MSCPRFEPGIYREIFGALTLRPPVRWVEHVARMKEDRKWKDSTITNVTGIVHKLKGRFKWTITGCIAEHQTELQFQVLRNTNLMTS